MPKWAQKPPIGTEIDWKNPLTKGLVSAVFFNEGAGPNAWDYARNQNWAIIGPGWANGRSGPALSANGSTTEVKLSAALITTGPYTILARVTPKATSGTYEIFTTGNLATAWTVQLRRTTSDWEYYHYDGANKVAAYTGGVVSGQPTYIAAVSDGTNNSLYVDSLNKGPILRATTAAGPAARSGITNTIARDGIDAGFDFYWDSLIDFVLIFNRALPFSDIQRHSSDPFNIFVPHSLRWFTSSKIFSFSISDSGVGSQAEPESLNRENQSLSQSGVGSQALVFDGSKVISQSSGHLQVVCTQNTYSRGISDSSIGTQGANLVYNSWDDPRNNQTNGNTVLGSSPFLFPQNLLFIVPSHGIGVENIAMTVNGITPGACNPQP